MTPEDRARLREDAECVLRVYPDSRSAQDLLRLLDEVERLEAQSRVTYDQIEYALSAELPPDVKAALRYARNRIDVRCDHPIDGTVSPGSVECSVCGEFRPAPQVFTMEPFDDVVLQQRVHEYRLRHTHALEEAQRELARCALERDKARAEVERLRADRAHYASQAGEDSCAAVMVERDELRAEVERLDRLCRALVGEEILHQDGLYETEMARVQRERDEARAEVERLRKLRWPNGGQG